MKKKSLEMNGKNIAYLEEGNPQNPCVLLLHGWPETSLAWKDIIPFIVDSGYRAIAPDLPGFGQSESFDLELTLDRYVEFIGSFMQQLSLTHVHLFLHDWGGVVGLKWASENPSQVLSLFLGDTLYTHYAKWHPLGEKFRIPQVGEQYMAGFANRESWNATMKKEIPTVANEVLEDFYQIFTTPKGLEVSLQLYRNTNFDELESEAGKLSRIIAPVTIVWGDNDHFTPKDIAFVIKENELPQSEVHIIPGAGHFIHLECPEKVQPFVKLHLDKMKHENDT
ncbi:alpha/beta fold hydrolase [Cohnella yongneupensis]|uniref:Alpha/beta fold hydrolase n=1 Tax=Cohnella yongneupensis TaxID=425006 RepID=A0ABW0QXR9_9BACL